MIDFQILFSNLINTKKETNFNRRKQNMAKTSWRFIFLEENESFTVSTEDSKIVGYVACRAPKGTTSAMFFPPNNESLINAMIGYGGATYPDIDEAIAFNSSYGLYISAPPGNNSNYGGFYITKRGLANFYNVKDVSDDAILAGTPLAKLDNIEDARQTKWPLSKILYEDGSKTKEFEAGWDEDNTGGAISLTWESDIPSLKETISEGESSEQQAQEYTIVGYVLEVKRADIVAWVNQKSMTAQSTKVTISNIGYDKYRYDIEIDVNAATDDLHIKGDDLYIGSELVTSDYVTKIIRKKSVDKEDKTTYSYYIVKLASDSADPKLVEMTEDGTGDEKLKKDIKYNTITLSCEETDSAGKTVNGGSWTGSLDIQGVDEYGSNIYFPNVINEDDLTFIEIRPNETFDDDLDETGCFTGTRIDTGTITISGKRQCSEVAEANITDGYTGGVWRETTADQVGYNDIIDAALEEAKSPLYDEASIFFECTGRRDFKQALANIRAAHDMSTVISPLVITAAEAKKTSTIVVEGRQRGTAQYLGEFQFYDKNIGKKYWVYPIGDVAKNLADIMDKRYGGVAPMWLNDNGLGGQLSRVPLKQKWNFSDEDTKILDQKGLNPITFDSQDGMMMLSQKTTELEAGDWSYLGHSMAFDLFKREMRDNVMKPQVGKPIDDYYLKTRQRDGDAIMDKRTKGGRPIWAKGVALINDSSVNTAATKAKRTFVIKAKVKVYVFSEYVELILVNEGQDA